MKSTTLGLKNLQRIEKMLVSATTAMRANRSTIWSRCMAR